MPMIFVNLPVRDLPAARAFYAALGFNFNEQFSDESSASVVIDDNIVVMLLTRDRFADFVAGEVGDPAQATTVLNCLTANTRDEVDDLAAKALEAGGKPWLPARDDGPMYGKSFTDPDGHVWEVLCMEPQHIIN